MSTIEVAAVLLGLVNVTLVVTRSMWNYPFGIAMVMLYAGIFHDAKLYSDALLQVFFLVVQLYGWWNWLRSRAEAGEVVVLAMAPNDRLRWILGTAVVSLAWGGLMDRFTDAHYPYWDAAVAMMSVAAQILQSRRFVESWVLWILVDLAAIPLYAVKDLWLTAALYAVFLALSAWGLAQWWRVRRPA